MSNKKQKTSISAKIIASSINTAGVRLTTFVVKFPRIVLAEFNTHRAFSRNSASSRAIPFKKMLKMVLTDPFIPIHWMKDHSGMQGSNYFKGFRVFLFIQLWLTARNFAVIMAWILSKLGLTKQIVNRLLEPFMWHTVIVTATDWENFFALRANSGAEIHIEKLAYLMLEEYNKSVPKLLEHGEWHIPFGDSFDEEKLTSENLGLHYDHNSGDNITRMKLKIATARCARVSYMNFEGKDDYKSDIMLYDRLASSGHWSPFEHCAKAIGNSGQYYGNLRGFEQIRKTIINENKSDERVKK